MFWALVIRVCRVLLFKNTHSVQPYCGKTKSTDIQSLLSVLKFLEDKRVPMDELTSESSQRG